MLIPSTITALRTRRYDSTWYIPGTIHGVENDPMDGGRRYGIQPPNVSDLFAFVVQFTSADYNRFYTGKVRHRSEAFDGRHEAIISQDLYDEVQEQLRKTNHRRPPRMPASVAPLTC